MVASVSETDRDTLKRCLTSLVDCNGHEVPTGQHFGLSCSEDLADAVVNVAGEEVAVGPCVVVVAADAVLAVVVARLSVLHHKLPSEPASPVRNLLQDCS